MKTINHILSFFLLTGLVLFPILSLAQYYNNKEIYEVIQQELRSIKYNWVKGVIEEPYNEFTLYPPPPPGYKGFDSTMVNYLIVHANLRHSEVEHFNKQIADSKTLRWDSNLLKIKTIKASTVDSLLNYPYSKIPYVRISIPLFSVNKMKMILIFDFPNRSEKHYRVLIYRRENKSWLLERSIVEK